MLIKMRTTSASPEGSRMAGKVYNVPDDQARPLIDAGAAEEITSDQAAKEDTTENRRDIERAAEGNRVNRVYDRYKRKTEAPVTDAPRGEVTTEVKPGPNE